MEFYLEEQLKQRNQKKTKKQLVNNRKCQRKKI